MTAEQKTDPVSTSPTPVPVRRRRVWPIVVVIGLLAAGGLYWRSTHSGAASGTAGRHGGHGGHGGFGNQPVPVQAGPVKSGDLHVYIDGLGTVTAANTAVVKSRVDGQLLRLHFQDGQMVKAGQLLAEIDPRPYQVQLTQASGQLAKDTAALKNAQLDLVRYRTLLAEDSIARQQVDTQAALVRQDAGAVKADQGTVDSARLNLTYANVTAPISGRLGLRQVDLGNIVHAADANGIVTIAQLQPIYVLFTIPETQIAAVNRALHGGGVPIDAFDRDQKARLASGKLQSMDNQIDQSTGTVRLKAEFDNVDGSLFPSQFVNVHMLVDTLHNAVLVPSVAIQRGSQGTIVFVVNNGTVNLRRIQTGPTEGDNTAVVSGLRPGEQVVIDGLDKLRDGARVQVIVPGAANNWQGNGHAHGGHGGHHHAHQGGQ